jgi:hypothetical protein
MLRALALSAIVLLAPAGAAPAFAQETTTFVRESQKVCSGVVPNNWRVAVPVYEQWSADDCMEYARNMGATHAQMGCIFNTRAANREPGRRPWPFSWGDLVPVTTNFHAGHRPIPVCGWTAQPAPRTP